VLWHVLKAEPDVSRRRQPCAQVRVVTLADDGEPRRRSFRQVIKGGE
jgi:hypothetical protein